MGLYIKERDVKDRLRGKVRFTSDPDDEDLMTERLLKRLVLEAEADVEMDFSPRFAAPFQTRDGKPFHCLPERPTKELIRTLCELKAVLRVLETDFGSGAVDAKDYVERTQKRYDKMLDRVIARRDKMLNQWLYPPLPMLRLNNHNTEADDGFMGMVINTSDEASYADGQINDPGKSWFDVTYKDLYGEDYGESNGVY